jgi:hypothetical protein
MAFGQYLGFIGGVVGAIIGGVLGAVGTYGFGAPAGAAWGFTIGSAIGGIAGQIFWPEKADINTPPPPQPHEARLQFSSWGMAIPIQYGSGRMAGNIIYMSDITETIERSRHRQDGVRYYEMTKTYTATFAIAFCEGPVTGIARIWMNNKIFVDFRDPDGPNYPSGSIALASGNLDTSIARSVAYFSIHFGEETQTADTTLVALLTDAETPAYRGMFYLVFIDFPIGEFSGVPQIEVEVGEVDEIVSGSPGVPPVIDEWVSVSFIGFTEFDYDDFISASSSTVTITAAGNDSLCYYAIQPDPDYGPDPEFRFGFNVTSLSGALYQECALIQVQETFGGDTVQVLIYVGASSLGIYLQGAGGNDSVSHVTVSYPFARYLRLAFTAAGTSTLKIYSDSGYTTLENTLEITGTNFSAAPSIQYVAVGLVSAIGQVDRSPLNMTISNLQVL